MLSGLKSVPPDAVYSTLESPVGKLWLIASRQGLHAILWKVDMLKPEANRWLAKLKRDDNNKLLRQTGKQLEEYFSGQRTEFNLPLTPAGTEFQKKVWRELRKIPYGKTISYAEQAERVGDAKKARAVGTANSRNPLSIVVPCHRVIAKSGALSGFGGGVPAKKFLLQLEQKALGRH